MAWFAVYQKSDGRLRSIASRLPEGEAALAADLDYREFADRPGGAGLQWNAATLDFDTPTPAAAPVWTRLDFMLRFSAAERIAIRRARQTSDPVDDFFNLVEMADSLHSDHPLVAQGLAFMVARGFLTQARADEIAGVA